MSDQNLSSWEPKAIDAVLAKNWDAQGAAYEKLSSVCGSFDWYAKRLPAGNGYDEDSYLSQCARLAQERDQLRAEIAKLQAEAEPFEAEFRSRPWKRYYLVLNSNGHVHRERHCSSCFPSTSYGWLVELADCDEAAMVLEYGEKACSICFPDAPSLPGFKSIGRVAQAARDAKAAEKAAKQAAKDAKAILDVDGQPLRIRGGRELVRTLVSAKIHFVDCLVDIQAFHSGFYHNASVAEENAQDAEKLIAAIAHKLGVPVDAIRPALEQKAAVKFRREYRR